MKIWGLEVVNPSLTRPALLSKSRLFSSRIGWIEWIARKKPLVVCFETHLLSCLYYITTSYYAVPLLTIATSERLKFAPLSSETVKEAIVCESISKRFAPNISHIIVFILYSTGDISLGIFFAHLCYGYLNGLFDITSIRSNSKHRFILLHVVLNQPPRPCLPVFRRLRINSFTKKLLL